MKKGFIVLMIATGLFACNSDDKKVTTTTVPLDSAAKEQAISDTSNYTTIEWLDSTYLDLGKLPEGKAVDMSFRFRNSGNKSLVIQNVSAQCGCTIPEKPERPIAPGEEGVIKAKFNGAGHGEVRKEVYVTANTSPNLAHTLTFRAELIK